MTKLPKKITDLLNCITENGYEAFIVGGCVRDILLHKTPHDWDVTTNALPEKIKEIFPKTIDTGIKHGTVTVILDGEPIEVTTYRTEGRYTDSRRPDSVNFVTNIADDLSRRDFTVNAIAYNPSVGIVDPFGGRYDLEGKILKTVGDAKTRFSEDALRIIRLYRFASVLGFNIEEDTAKAATRLAKSLEKVSVERIYTELKKAVCGDNTAALVPLIQSGGLEFLKIDKVCDLKPLSQLKNSENLRLYAFLKLSSNSPVLSLDLLKASNAVKEYFNKMKVLEQLYSDTSDIGIKRMLNICDKDIIFDFTEYKKVICGTNCDDIKLGAVRIINLGHPYKISHLDIDGCDIKSIGISGKNIGVALDFLLEKVMENPQLNNKQILLNLIQNLGN